MARKNLTPEQFALLKHLKSTCPGMTIKEIVQLSGLGYSAGYVSHMLSFDSFGDYCEYKKQKNEKQKIRNHQKNAVEKPDAETEEDVAEDPDMAPYVREIKNISLRVTELLHEQQSTKHFMEAMFEEQKNTSRLIRELIDLWRR